MTPIVRLLEGPEDTEALGRAVARVLRRGDAVCLWGPLGAGKTCLARGLIRALTRPDEEIPSPTFTLAQTYEAASFAIAHFDLYRLSGAAEADELGIEEALEEGAAVIEWPDRLEARLPPDRLDITLAMEGEGRCARLEPHGAWKDRPLEF
jgi:tRNA threonylcarbamoyladenosine biosynthesis protein TsaE